MRKGSQNKEERIKYGQADQEIFKAGVLAQTTMPVVEDNDADNIAKDSKDADNRQNQTLH